MRNRRRGFSLIEILIAVAIIMILSAIVIDEMNQQLMMAHETAVVSEIRTIHTTEAQYFAQFGRYAPNLAALDQVTAIPQEFGSSGAANLLFGPDPGDSPQLDQGTSDRQQLADRISLHILPPDCV
jgi:prepilin-type N-terminal cleavage/methylation domain-containing protein